MKLTTLLLCASALSLLTTTSNAENVIYVGVAGGLTDVSLDNIDEGTSTKFFIGFNPDKHIALEASLYTTGKASITSTQAVTLETDGYNVSALYVIPNTLGSISTAFGAGIYMFKTNVQDPQLEGFGDTIQDSNGASLHARAQYVLFDSVALRADLDVFLSVSALSENKTVTSLMLGAAYQF